MKWPIGRAVVVRGTIIVTFQHRTVPTAIPLAEIVDAEVSSLSLPGTHLCNRLNEQVAPNPEDHSYPDGRMSPEKLDDWIRRVGLRRSGIADYCHINRVLTKLQYYPTTTAAKRVDID